MPLRIAALIATGGLALAAPASAHVHTVQPGETLWGIAAVNGVPVSAVAAASGLSPTAHVVVATNVTVPAAATTVSTAVAPAASGAASSTGSATTPEIIGAYTVRPGDTLSGLAARSRVPLAQMAYVNGLDPAQPLLVGTVLKLPTGSPVRATTPAPAQRVVPAASPTPTNARLDASQIATIAAQQGVPSSLAAAIAYQESGFNNAMVSPANARGIMQILPGTWDWVQTTLAGGRLNPASATDNVRAGSLYLAKLLRDTGGDATTAAAAYYQGLSSVQRIGLLPETRRYVANVQALRARFGG
jgi:soluble lytic murein transglycosylase-like protein